MRHLNKIVRKNEVCKTIIFNTHAAVKVFQFNPVIVPGLEVVGINANVKNL